jgi:subtilisin family serine protease
MIEYGRALNDITNRFDTCSERLIGETYSVYMPIKNIPNNMFQLYGYGAFPNCYGLLDIESLAASQVTKIQSIPTFGLRGQGVLIGVIDTGIDYTHPAFRNEDGTSKIFSIWDQSIESENAMPEGFEYGTEYTKNQINEALASDNPYSIVASVDEDGHGTFMAGIAAGNRSEENKFSGVVPDAELLVVKLKPSKKYIRDFWRIPEETVCFQKNDLIQGIKYLVDKAEKEKKPISLLIGIGTSQGAHDEKGALSRYLSILATYSGVGVTLACGNEGNRGHHYSAHISNGVEYDSVELKVGSNVSGFSMEFWGRTPNAFSIDILSPTGETVPRIPARLSESREIRLLLEETIINIDYQLVESQSGDQLILVRFLKPTEGIWRFRVYPSSNLNLDYHIWLPIHQFIGPDTFFTKPDINYTITSPANVNVPIVVTAYDYNNNSIYNNSSRGFTRTETIAPTIAAPGVNMVGPTLKNAYRVSSGTSIAAAHTAGIVAMFLEWGILRENYKSLSTVEIKNLLIRGAKRESTIAYPDKEWGYGIIDLYGAYNSLRGDT